MQSISKFTARRLSNLLTMTSPSTFEALVNIYGKAPFNTSISGKKLSRYCTHTTGTLTEYIVRNITITWIAITQGARIQTFLNLSSSHLMFNRTKNIFEELLRKKDRFNSRF